MKHNRGNMPLSFYLSVFLLLLSSTLLCASDFSYKINVNKKTPYVKESVVVTVDLNQTNHDIVLLFDFDLKKSKDYTFRRLNVEEIDAYHAVQIRYTYLLYPLREGTVDINFKLTQKATTDESIAYSFSGDRDNVKGLVTTNTAIELPALQLQVKALPKKTQLVGDFSLDFECNKYKAEPFEPIPIQVHIKGRGYPPLLDTVLPKEGNFTRFTESPRIKSHVTTEGTNSIVTYTMALSHDTNFTLMPIAIQAFNPTLGKPYTLKIPKQKFTIHPVDTKTLVDNIDSPQPLHIDFSWIEVFFGYLIVFIAGYLSALTWKSKSKKSKKEEDPLKSKIQHAKTDKQLLQILLSHDVERFKSVIKKLEGTEDSISLHTLKKEALERFT